MHPTGTILRSATLLGCVALLAAACAGPRGASPADRRAYVDDMAERALDRLAELDSTARASVDIAPGYAVFSNVSAQVLFVGGGNGFGLVQDNDTGRRTYMRMAQLGVGFGVGLQDFRAVFVFDDRATLERFTVSGWEFGGQAQAEMADAGDGPSAQAATSISDPLHIYRITEAGIALSARLDGTRYWPDDELN
ncbi:MAG: hypothetical protein IPM29_05730 [Planctomycetes bacterium]|nr:hypothetical protein [Planctomycetota bacterium]